MTVYEISEYALIFALMVLGMLMGLGIGLLTAWAIISCDRRCRKLQEKREEDLEP